MRINIKPGWWGGGGGIKAVQDFAENPKHNQAAPYGVNADRRHVSARHHGVNVDRRQVWARSYGVNVDRRQVRGRLYGVSVYRRQVRSRNITRLYGSQTSISMLRPPGTWCLPPSSGCAHPVVTQWSPNGHPMATQWSPNGHPMVTTFFQAK